MRCVLLQIQLDAHKQKQEQLQGSLVQAHWRQELFRARRKKTPKRRVFQDRAVADARANMSASYLSYSPIKPQEAIALPSRAQFENRKKLIHKVKAQRENPSLRSPLLNNRVHAGGFEDALGIEPNLMEPLQSAAHVLYLLLIWRASVQGCHCRYVCTLDN